MSKRKRLSDAAVAKHLSALELTTVEKLVIENTERVLDAVRRDAAKRKISPARLPWERERK